jgi:2-polyprenyl-3-methyl-5-hydroxy-6-metoxy-1,4-benzoquinol methylase
LNLAHRELIPEEMDDPSVDVHGLKTGLGFLEWANSWFGGTKILIGAIARDWAAAPAPALSCLDVGTGAGDIPRAVAAWARERRLPVRSVGLDLHPLTARLARDLSQSEGVSIVRGDALVLPFADRTFDFSISSTFLHHLDDEQSVLCLSEMGRVSRRWVFVADLVRSWTAYGTVKALTLVAGNALTRHDGPVSVRRSFTIPEVERIAARAGLVDVKVSGCFPFRFLLSGRKP